MGNFQEKYVVDIDGDLITVKKRNTDKVSILIDGLDLLDILTSLTDTKADDNFLGKLKPFLLFIDKNYERKV